MLTCLGCTSMMQFERVFFPQKMLAQTSSSLETQKPLSETAIKAIARNITIQIETEENKPLGSGVIVRQQALTEVLNLNQKPRYLYTVLTAHHVVKKRQANREHINIITPDNQQRLIDLDSTTQIDNNDLAIFYFISANQYSPARLGSSNNLKKVFSAGFPCEVTLCEEELTLTSGIVAPSEILAGHESFQGGFSIGHDSEIYNGMSGGAILNTDGLLVGINNRKKYPTLLFANSQYRYQDGSQPSKIVAEIIPFFAWGISIETYTEFVEQPNIHSSESTNSELESDRFEQLQYKLHYLSISHCDRLLFLFWLVVLLFWLSILLLPDKSNKCESELDKKQLPPREQDQNDSAIAKIKK